MKIDFKKSGGLVPVIIQDAETLQVLMLGYMNEEALRLTKKEGKVYFWSRSKERIWMKGETSGNALQVSEITDDCDSDSILVKVKPAGPTCHTGSVSCFSDSRDQRPSNINSFRQGRNTFSFLRQLIQLIADRKNKMPEGSYTASLFKDGLGKICGKVSEEAGEVVIAALSETDQRLIEESADLMYHMFVLLEAKGVSFEDVVAELKKRRF